MHSINHKARIYSCSHGASEKLCNHPAAVIMDHKRVSHFDVPIST